MAKQYPDGKTFPEKDRSELRPEVKTGKGSVPNNKKPQPQSYGE